MKSIKLFPLILFVFIFSFGGSAYAQSPKKYFKTGEEFKENKNYKDAITQYSKAIDGDSKYVDAYVARAESYRSLSNLESAIEDYLRALTFDSDNEDYLIETSKLYFETKQFEKAIEYADKTIVNDKKNLVAYNTKIQSQLNLKEYDKAITTINLAIEIKKSAPLYYSLGIAYQEKSEWEKAALNFKEASDMDEDFIDAFLALSNSQLELKKLEEAMTTCNKVIAKDEKNTDALVIRSKIYRAKLDYPSAIADLSKALLLAKEEDKDLIYLERGISYLEFKQAHLAVTDFNTILYNKKKEDYNIEVLYARASAFEATHQYEKAVEDYETLRKITPFDEKASILLDKASERLYELNKENEKPSITFIDPQIIDGKSIPVRKGIKEATITAQIKDASKITSILVGEKSVEFNKDTLNPSFQFDLKPDETKSIQISVTDIYKNKAEITYNVISTEIDTPSITILAPYASDDGEIYLENDNSILYLEGKISDESKIKSVFVDGATASFLVDQLNPSFSATISIANKGTITVIVEDIYGNKSSKQFKLNREGARIAADNPMGKTWVVFIENSNYNSFASLEGPSKDVREMNSALANYRVHNIIKKKDLTKKEFERFFSIELRDLVRSNKVNSILVWYAGHGKFLNESGYWIPVDAKRDDEFTYFNINSLKAAMQSYSKYITHTLVVTDACESGPSFYQAMRSAETERRCDDWQATRFKSSQVLSSAGYELASDNSQFTKTFVNSLDNNPNTCIPIDQIVVKVKESVSKEGGQKPQFGKIQGLEDENGTFFFIKK